MSLHGMAEPGSLDVDIPPDTDDVLNAWDDVTDEVDDVAGPQDLRWAGQPLHAIAEFYSPPRALPSARMRGLVGCFSLDLLTGWDLMCSHVRALARQLLETFAVQVLILSPPCTAFSQLQALWNYKRMSAAAVRAKWAEGMAHLTCAADCALTQHLAGRVPLGAPCRGDIMEDMRVAGRGVPCWGLQCCLRPMHDRACLPMQQDSHEETHEAHVKLDAFHQGPQRERV